MLFGCINATSENTYAEASSFPLPDDDYARFFVGTWDMVEFVVDGKYYSASLMQDVKIVLNSDGTAFGLREGEAPYAMRWYTDNGCVYVGSSVNAVQTGYINEYGNLHIKQCHGHDDAGHHR